VSSPFIRSAAAALILLVTSASAHAGQVRVDVSSNFFAPDQIQLNLGDHVCWVWIAGGHSSTSGPATGIPDGKWNSGLMNTTASFKPGFTWKSTLTGNVAYFCSPHVGFGMIGQLQISASGVAVSNFRITEVHYSAAAGADRIQITNMGNATGDLARYRLTTAATTSATTTATIPGNTVPVLPGASVTAHWGLAGTNTATDLFFSAVSELANTGSFSLYAPNTATGTTFNDATQIIDFVQWGVAGRPNEATAANAIAGLWTAGDFVNGETNGAYSISFCGSATQHGAAQWQISTPNFGTTPLCTTPTITTSWGRLKTLYR
jgi:plastocyanin